MRDGRRARHKELRGKSQFDRKRLIENAPRKRKSWMFFFSFLQRLCETWLLLFFFYGGRAEEKLTESTALDSVTLAILNFWLWAQKNQQDKQRTLQTPTSRPWQSCDCIIMAIITRCQWSCNCGRITRDRRNDSNLPEVLQIFCGTVDPSRQTKESRHRQHNHQVEGRGYSPGFISKGWVDGQRRDAGKTFFFWELRKQFPFKKKRNIKKSFCSTLHCGVVSAVQGDVLFGTHSTDLARLTGEVLKGLKKRIIWNLVLYEGFSLSEPSDGAGWVVTENEIDWPRSRNVFYVIKEEIKGCSSTCFSSLQKLCTVGSISFCYLNVCMKQWLSTGGVWGPKFISQK